MSRPGIGIGKIQGPGHNKSFNLYEQLQDKILKETGVTCSVLVKPHLISIITKDYTDFVLAKAAIKGSTSLPIERAES